MLILNLVVCFRGGHNTNEKYESLFKKELITVIKIINGKKYLLDSLEIIISYYNKVVYCSLQVIIIHPLYLYIMK